MYLLNNMERYSVRVDGATQRLTIEQVRRAMAYAPAAELAARDARSDSRLYRRLLPFVPSGSRIPENGD